MVVVIENLKKPSVRYKYLLLVRPGLDQKCIRKPSTGHNLKSTEQNKNGQNEYSVWIFTWW